MSDIVKVDIPAKAEHLLVVRLAASGICSRLGMGIEQMEDVKAAVAEACLIMIHDQAGYRRLAIAFEYSDNLWISVNGTEPGGESTDDEIDADFSLALLEALTEKTTVGEGSVLFKARGGSKR